jgi:hypothetical protein
MTPPGTDATTDLTVPCLFCGRPAQPHVHHGRPDDVSQGKGMGGAKDWPEHDLYDICDDHHKSLHDKKWSFRSVDGMVELLAPGDEGWVIGRRGLVLTDGGSENYLCWTDEALAVGWAEGDEAAMGALQVQCEIAWALKERYAHTTHKWYERAAEILSEQGKHVHWRRVYERCDLMALFGPTEEHPQGRWQAMEKLGMTVALAITRLPADERAAALELALDLNAEFKPALEITAAIKGDVAEIAKERHVCGDGPGCGHEHTRKGD